MKSVFKIVMMIVLLAALAGGAYLVTQNQNTKKGATQAESGVSLLAGSTSVKPGDQFDVQLWLNSGTDTDTIMGFDVKVDFDRTKLKYVSTTGLKNFQLITETVDSGSGPLTIQMVTLGTEPAGANNLATIKFEAVSEGSVNLSPSGKMQVSSSATTWDIAKVAPLAMTVANTNVSPTSGTITLPKATVNTVVSSNTLKVGDEVVATVKVNTGTNKISAVDITVATNGGLVVKTDASGQAVVAVDPYFSNVDAVRLNSIKKGIVLKLSSPQVDSNLKSGDITIAKITLVATAAGMGSVELDTSYGNNMAGPSATTGFQIEKGSVGELTVEAGATPTTGSVEPTLVPTIQPTLTPTPTTAPIVFKTCSGVAGALPKNKGNANCDAKIDTLDFEVWRREAMDEHGMTTKKTGWDADFDQNQYVNMADYVTYLNSVKGE